MNATPNAPEPIPVIVLTGFLGSGKTTLLNDLLADPAFADTAVVVNEFGDIPVDHDLVTVGSADMMVTSTGCLCCAAGSDIRSSLFELREARRARHVPPFRRVVVETTGLADPAPVINQLVRGAAVATSVTHFAVAEQYRLAGVVCTVDAIFGADTLERFFECTKQVAFADRIVLTKTDLAEDPATKADVARFRQRISAINSVAPVLDRRADGLAVADLFEPRPYAPESLHGDVEDWLALEAALAATGRPEHGGSRSRHAPNGIDTASHAFDRPVDRRDFDAFVDVLKLAAGPRLLRLKGLVALSDDPDRPLVVQVVQHSVHPPRRLDAWPSPDRRSRFVTITSGIDREALASLFAALGSRRRVPSLTRWFKAAAGALALLPCFGSPDASRRDDASPGTQPRMEEGSTGDARLR